MQTLYRQQTFLTVRPLWRKQRRRLHPAIPLVLSCGFLAFGVQTLIDQIELDRQGIATKAVITGRTPAGWLGGQSEVRYRFDIGERTFEGTSGVASGLWGRTSAGDTIAVQYLPSNPELSRCAEATGYRGAYLLCGVGGGLLLIPLKLRRRRAY